MKKKSLRKNNTGLSALAIAAHPDNIEFMQAGTLMLLAQQGWDIHYFNIANGHCGSATMTKAAIVRIRRKEARAACKLIGARWYPPLCDDIAIFYNTILIRKVCALVRKIRPRIILTQSPSDYMEDHQNASRLAVAAAFCRGMKNFPSLPVRKPVFDPVTVYHALPYGLEDGLRHRVAAGQYVDITAMIDKKTAMLACHRSQKEWLDESQGMDSYLITMQDMSREVGSRSGGFAYAEGWRRHSHLGFTEQDTDPLSDALGDKVITDQDYEKSLV